MSFKLLGFSALFAVSRRQEEELAAMRKQIADRDETIRKLFNRLLTSHGSVAVFQDETEGAAPSVTSRLDRAVMPSAQGRVLGPIQLRRQQQEHEEEKRRMAAIATPKETPVEPDDDPDASPDLTPEQLARLSIVAAV